MGVRAAAEKTGRRDDATAGDLRGRSSSHTRAVSTFIIALALATLTVPINNVRLVAAAAPIAIYPSQDIQASVTAAPAGSTFLLKPGIHRMRTIRPKDGDTFVGEPGAVLSGARLLTTFVRSGRYYIARGQTQQGERNGSCAEGYPRCSFPEQLFINDQLLRHVASLGEVEPGTWYFDYAADAIYIVDIPAGRRVETSITTTAFEPTADNVAIRGLIVEKYANWAQHGAISAENRSGWVVAGNEIRSNHGVGIRIGPGSQIIENNIHHNGHVGISGIGDQVLVEHNEIAFNNNAHFDPGWEGGGAKFVMTDGLVVRGNFVHHNYGPGLWTDIDNINTLYEENTCEDNERMGIIHEISYQAVIRNNVIRRNGFGWQDWIWGAGILVSGSPNVEVYGNIVENNADGIGGIQQKRGGGRHGPYELTNFWVHDNTVIMNQGWTGIVQDIGDTSYFISRKNRFERNTYQLGADAVYFTWMNQDRSETQWKSYGLDQAGVFSR